MATWSKNAKENIAVGRGRLRKLLPSGVWHFFHRSKDGRWASRSTRHRDKAGAIRWSEAFSLNLTKAEFGITEPVKPEDVPSPLRALVTWLRYHRQQSSPYTVRSYRSIAKKFWAFLRSRRVRQLDQMTRETMTKFRTWCLAKGNSRVTVDNNLIALRAFFSWTVAKGWLSDNPASDKHLAAKLFFNEATVRKEAYTGAENDLILRAATGDDRDVFVLLGSWGLRISELAMLEWTDIDNDGGWVRIRNKVTHDGVRYHPKDKTDRKFPLAGEQVLSVLDRFAARTGRAGYVLPLPKVKSRRDYAERHFIGRLKKLADPTEVPETKLTLHRFRRFFVSECADHGVPMATTMEWVGHDELKMVLYYYSLRDESAREAMRRLVGGQPAKTDGAAVTIAPASGSTSTPAPDRPSKNGARRGRRAS